MDMDANLHPSLRPFLSPLDREELHASYQDHGNEVSLPTFKLSDGKELGQMADHFTFEVLSEMIHSQDHEGAVIQLSSSVCAVFSLCETEILLGPILLQTRLGQDGKTEFVPMGPGFDSFWRLRGRREDMVSCKLFVAQTSIPIEWRHVEDLGSIIALLRDSLSRLISWGSHALEIFIWRWGGAVSR